MRSEWDKICTVDKKVGVAIADENRNTIFFNFYPLLWSIQYKINASVHKSMQCTTSKCKINSANSSTMSITVTKNLCRISTSKNLNK